MRINHVYSFTPREENIIKEALLKQMKGYEDENGEVCEKDMKAYLEVHNLYLSL